MQCLPCVDRLHVQIRPVKIIKKPSRKPGFWLVLLLISGISIFQPVTAYSIQTFSIEVSLHFLSNFATITSKITSSEIVTPTLQAIATVRGYDNFIHAVIGRKYDVVLPIAFSVEGEGCPVAKPPSSGCKL